MIAIMSKCFWSENNNIAVISILEGVGIKCNIVYLKKNQYGIM